MEFSEITYKSISLFSGLGGDSLGMVKAGCKLIAYNELKPAFHKSHDANFPDSELIHDGTICDISKLKDAVFEKYNGISTNFEEFEKSFNEKLSVILRQVIKNYLRNKSNEGAKNKFSRQ